MLQSTVWYLMKPWAPHRGSRITIIPRTCKNCQERETDREREQEKMNDLKIKIRYHALYESYLIYNKFQWFVGSIPNAFRRTFRQRESEHTETLIGRHPIGHL